MLFFCADVHAANFVSCSMASCCVYADTPIRRYSDTSPLCLRLRRAVTPVTPVLAPCYNARGFITMADHFQSQLPAARADGRSDDQLRPLRFTTGIAPNA